MVVVLALSFCAKTGKRPVRSDCQGLPNQNAVDACYVDKAVSQGKPSICEKISQAGIKDVCYQRLAVGLKDPALCDRVEEDTAGHACLQMVAINMSEPSLCASISEPAARDTCYLKLAQEEGKELCEKIENQGTIKQCRSMED